MTAAAAMADLTIFFNWRIPQLKAVVSPKSASKSWFRREAKPCRNHGAETTETMPKPCQNRFQVKYLKAREK
jgi:hypothetical protein